MATSESAAPDAPSDTHAVIESVIESINPTTGEVLGTVPVCSAEEVAARVSRARVAAAQWGALDFAERARELVAWRHALAARAEDLADLIHQENGKPRTDALIEVLMALAHLAYATDRAEKVLAPRRVSPGFLANQRATISYHPLGVVGIIGPWNYPIFTPVGSMAFALAAGNAVVFKPSELTPLVGQMITDIAASSMAIPDLVQVVTGGGATGAALARSGVGKIAFTGSTATGRKVMMAAAETLTPVLLELGGKDPLIVAEDADVEQAAEAAVFGAFTNAGQTCISIERAYVVESVYDAFVDRVVAHARAVRVGPDGDIGAMIRPEQAAIVHEQIRDAVARGARALVGGPDAVEGNVCSPTVLVDVTDDMKIMQEETFGPVLPIIKVATAEDGVRRANASSFGLGSAVFGRAGVRELAESIRAGMTGINTVLTYAAISSLPFGGVGESGFGRIHGDEGLLEFVRVKSTAEERVGLPEALDLQRFGLSEVTYDRVRQLIGQLYGGGTLDRAGRVLRRLRRRIH